ncbi:hypothetical protein E4U42_002402 [Claviceps africana]|uniref:YAG7-like dimerisation domain-containing protein n=1 Tax=Claviceps africana TaxID=83212 RepID=A0A8K0NHH6_9HYPO|nr:hypothetical protein E4U42_002402 [Claviceps africana]
MAVAATQPTSKASKKKLANAIERVSSPAPSAGSGAAADSQDEGYESPYIRELQKNIRNLNKKIANASKTDSILRQHAGTPLDELVISRVINTDQKVQIEKKPALQAQLAQMEQQLAQFQRVHDQYRLRTAADKAEWEKSLEKAKEDAVGEAKAGFQQSLKDNLLTLSQFLRLAAYRREEASDPESDESQAVEGVLLAIYAGDDNAVSSMLKLVQGSDDKVFSVPGEELQTTYSVVKSLATEYKSPFYEGSSQPDGAAPETAVGDAALSPTIDGETTAEIAAGEASTTDERVVTDVSEKEPVNASVASDATNAVAESQWDTENGLSASQEWVDVKVPCEPSETETQPDGTPPPPPPPHVAATESKSWADDQPESTATEPHSAANEPRDGFHSVPRNRSRQEREGSGNWRGRGRGDHRGRGGHRGDMRGRGRGRGGLPSRPRRSEESS